MYSQCRATKTISEQIQPGHDIDKKAKNIIIIFNTQNTSKHMYESCALKLVIH